MPYVRRTARVLVVDGTDRLLLMRFRFQPDTMPRPYGWLTPAAGVFRDDFFYLRVDRHDVDTSRMEDLEMSVHAGERWWSVDELATTDEIVYPYELVPLLIELLGGRRRAEPVVLPWHHASDPTETSAAN